MPEPFGYFGIARVNFAGQNWYWHILATPMNLVGSFIRTTSRCKLDLGALEVWGNSLIMIKAISLAMPRWKKPHKNPAVWYQMSNCWAFNRCNYWVWRWCSRVVTAGATSPFPGHGIGIARLNNSDPAAGSKVKVGCRDGSLHHAELVLMRFYDALAEIPPGKRVDIPQRWNKYWNWRVRIYLPVTKLIS